MLGHPYIQHFAYVFPWQKCRLPPLLPTQKQWSNIGFKLPEYVQWRTNAKERKRKKNIDYTLDIKPWLHLIQICHHDVYTWICIFDLFTEVLAKKEKGIVKSDSYVHKSPHLVESAHFYFFAIGSLSISFSNYLMQYNCLVSYVLLYWGLKSIWTSCDSGSSSS